MTFDGHAFQLDFRRPLATARVPEAGEELFFACGGNMLVRRASFLAAGGFAAEYFAYLEDVDLGWRLWAGGERILFAPAAVVRHRSSATSDLLGLYNRGFLFERNAFLTAYTNYEPGLWERMMPALLLTFMARTQALLAGNNRGGETLAIDPYAGWIANTAPRGGHLAKPAPPAPPLGHPAFRLHPRRPRRAPARVRRPRPPAPRLAEAPRSRGRPRPRAVSHPRRRADHRPAPRPLLPPRPPRHRRRPPRRRPGPPPPPRPRDLRPLPPYLVPTYPGDAELFASPGFEAWLPQDLPLVRAELGEIMEMD